MGLFGRRKKDSRDLFTIPEGPSSASTSDTGASRDFRMVVAEVFLIAKRGVVAAGTVDAGVASAGCRVVLERDGQQLRTLEIAAIEQFRKRATEAVAGEHVGLLFRDLAKEDIVAGDVLRA